MNAIGQAMEAPRFRGMLKGVMTLVGTGAVVEDPVHRGFTDSGLTRYLRGRAGVGARCALMDS